VVATIPENSIHGPLRAISSSVASVRLLLTSIPPEIAIRWRPRSLPRKTVVVDMEAILRLRL
jgi:hypothetical protein